MHTFVRQLITEWRRLKMPSAGAGVVVGVSGGADSVSLLLALCELNKRKKLDLRLVAGHFNHNLRGAESDADEEFVRKLTIKHGIEFVTAKAGTLHQKGNLEQNARDGRYAFLTAAAERLNAFAVLTGHTVNDQAETFLLNLVRGSGTEGLGGMRTVRSFEFEVPSSESILDNSELETRNAEPETHDAPLLPFSSTPQLLLVRPMLTWARRIETEGYCRDSGVEYRYDTMNEDTAFKRVRIRKILLPLLEDMNPRIIETLANTAALMQAAGTSAKTENQIEISDELLLADLKALPQDELYQAIRAWLKRHRGSTRRLQLKHIQAIGRLILSPKSGRTAELPGGKAVKGSGRLRYEENKV